jgi:methylglyoxal reductase
MNTPAMETRTIGASGVGASAIGLGTWAIGGWMWGGTDEADSSPRSVRRSTPASR